MQHMETNFNLYFSSLRNGKLEVPKVEMLPVPVIFSVYRLKVFAQLESHFANLSHNAPFKSILKMNCKLPFLRRWNKCVFPSPSS